MTRQYITEELKAVLLDIFFRAAPSPTTFYMGLTTAQPDENLELAHVTDSELSPLVGYRRVMIDRDAWKLEGTEVVAERNFFRNLGDKPWSAVRGAFVLASPQELIVTWMPFDNARLLFPGDTLQVPAKISL